MPRFRSLFRRFPSHRRGVRASWLLGGVGVLLLLLFVWEQASVDRLIIRLRDARAENRELVSEVNALAMEADQLSSLAQVKERAAAELGLRRPSTEQIVRLRFEPFHESTPQFALNPLPRDAEAASAREDGSR